VVAARRINSPLGYTDARRPGWYKIMLDREFAMRGEYAPQLETKTQTPLRFWEK